MCLTVSLKAADVILDDSMKEEFAEFMSTKFSPGYTKEDFSSILSQDNILAASAKEKMQIIAGIIISKYEDVWSLDYLGSNKKRNNIDSENLKNYSSSVII